MNILFAQLLLNKSFHNGEGGNSALWPRDGANNRGALGEGWARLEGITEYA